ncbi:MAG: ATP-dependent DNA helicase RecG [Myxococcales bacterium]|jgi:ATP-dependent DNA helicase RecG
MPQPPAQQAIAQRLARALSYAARDGFARLRTLRGFEAFVRAVAKQAVAAGADRGWAARLDRCCQGFDTADDAGRRRQLGALAALLAEVGALPESLRSLAPGEPAGPAIGATSTVGAPERAPAQVGPGPAPAKGADAKERPAAKATARSAAGPAAAATTRSASKPAAKATTRSAALRPARRKASPSGKGEPEAEAIILPTFSPRAGPLATPLSLVMPLRGRLGSTLKRRGMSKAGEVLFFFPRAYEDRRRLVPINQLRPGERGFSAGKVTRIQESFTGRRRMLRVVLSDGKGSIAATWYKFWPSMRDRFQVGQRWLFAGEVRVFGGHWEIVHPEMEPDDEHGRRAAGLGEIVPIYPGLDHGEQRGFRLLARAVADRFADQIVDPVPPAILRRAGLPPLAQAVRSAHVPGSEILAAEQAPAPARRRLAFDELFFIELGMALRRKAVAKLPGIAFEAGPERLREALELLPFAPTAAQRRALGEIAGDMRRPSPMNRLLQGDVGSGKTAVAGVAAELAIRSGYQAALLAPTEVLAEQHLRTLRSWFEERGRRVALLTASVPKRAKDKVKAALARGEIDLLVGTHAIIQEDVDFQRLGLVIIDEQHRFGVLQRAALVQKGVHPDVLVMTATPIPRTLAMALYGDLDVSVLNELPPGRTPVETRVFPRRQRDEAYRLVAEQVAQGRQAFVVYPLVEESEKLDLASATEGAAELAGRFPSWRIGLLHGRMKADEKDAVMSAFRAHELDVLVSTTVIEVGVDVPNAAVMVVESAERFGLSQLHQLRGRVGRGGGRAWCLLVAALQGETATARLAVMERTTDGFVIADEDLRLRGPGEFLGTRQSGLPPLMVADFARDADLLEIAREEALRLVDGDPRLDAPEHAGLRQAIEERWGERLELTRVG